jgi:hypothetical protein
MLEDTMICSSEINDAPIASTSMRHIQQEQEWQEDTQETIYPPQEQQHSSSFQEPVDPDSIPEPIMDEERIPYTLPIHIFGEDIVACVLSIKAKCRTRGLGQIEKKIQSLNAFAQSLQLEALSMLIYIDGFIPSALEEEEEEDMEQEMDDETRAIAHFVNATLMMIQEAVMDSREPIVSLAITTWQQLVDFAQQTGIETGCVIEWTERAFSGLLKRTGDTNVKIKQAAVSLVLELVQIYHTPPFALMSLFVCKPERVIHNHKEAKARVELVEATVMKLGVSAADQPRQKKAALLQVPLPHVMAFVVAYLNHGNEDVRQAAIKLVVCISDQIGFHLVRSYIDETLILSLAEVR